MKCEKCNSENLGVHDRTAKPGHVRMKCKDCRATFFIENADAPSAVKKPKVGMSLDEFRKKHDVEFIVQNIMESLDKSVIYEKKDIYQLSTLSPSYPGLSAAIDNCTDHHGKAGGKVFFSHPDTIEMLKENGKLM